MGKYEPRYVKSNKKYACTLECGKRYRSLTAFKNHVQKDHKGEVQPMKQYNKQYDQFKKSKEPIPVLVEGMRLEDLGVNKNDFDKIKLARKMLHNVGQIFGPQCSNLFVDTKKSEQKQCTEIDLRGQTCQNDKKLQDLEKDLIDNKYKLGEIITKYQVCKLAEFQQSPTVDQQGRQGKIILMKKEFGQYFNLEYASKIYVQLNICAATDRGIVEPQHQARIQKCEQHMWGKYHLLGELVKRYYSLFKRLLKLQKNNQQLK